MRRKLTIFNFVKLITLCFLLVACNNDAAPECFTATGNTIEYTAEVDSFTGIHVLAGVELVIVQGNEQKVSITTGENIKEYITAEVIDSTLWLTNANNCNWVHKYNTTVITVTTPDLKNIFTASQFVVRSQGVLTFPNLSVLSGITAETASGTVELQMDSRDLTIQDNQNLYCIIKGSVDNLVVNFYSGDARFDGAGLMAQNAQVFHRSSNDIIINATQQVTGTIYSTGNLVLLNQPAIIKVEQVYTGHVVYE